LSAVWTAAFAICVLIAVVGVSPPPTIAFLLAMGLTTGVVVSLAFPLGVAGAAHGGFNVAVVGALLNICWATSGLLGPMIGGTSAQLIDDRIWFLALAVLGLGVAGWMWRRRGASPAPVGVDDGSRRSVSNTSGRE